MKKIIFLLIVSIFVNLLNGYESKANNEPKYEEKAIMLKDLGLFKGTNNGFELERPATRIESLVMLIRLIGEESVALKWTGDISFTDVPSWAKPYVGYAYEKGITKGLSDTLFGSGQTASANQFLTFILRALGYDDTKGDFSWDQAIAMGQSLNLITSEQSELYQQQEYRFLRDDCAGISYDALNLNVKGSDQSLLDYLVDKGAVEKIEVIGNTSTIPVKASTSGRLEISTSLLRRAFPEVTFFSHSNFFISDIDQIKKSIVDTFDSSIVNNSFLPIDGREYYEIVPSDRGVDVLTLLDQNYQPIAYYLGDLSLSSKSVPLENGYLADVSEALERVKGLQSRMINVIQLPDTALDTSIDYSEKTNYLTYTADLMNLGSTAEQVVYYNISYSSGTTTEIYEGEVLERKLKNSLLFASHWFKPLDNGMPYPSNITSVESAQIEFEKQSGQNITYFVTFFDQNLNALAYLVYQYN